MDYSADSDKGWNMCQNSKMMKTYPTYFEQTASSIFWESNCTNCHIDSMA